MNLKNDLEFIDLYLKSEGWINLVLFALLTFVFYMCNGLTLIVTVPATKMFYEFLIEAIS